MKKIMVIIALTVSMSVNADESRIPSTESVWKSHTMLGNNPFYFITSTEIEELKIEVKQTMALYCLTAMKSLRPELKMMIGILNSPAKIEFKNGKIDWEKTGVHTDRVSKLKEKLETNVDAFMYRCGWMLD